MIFISVGLIILSSSLSFWSLLAAEVIYSAALKKHACCFCTRESLARSSSAVWLTNISIQLFLIITFSAITHSC